MSGVKPVSRNEEALADGGSFPPQNGIIAQHYLAFWGSRTTCLAISTNLLSGLWYSILLIPINLQQDCNSTKKP